MGHHNGKAYNSNLNDSVVWPLGFLYSLLLFGSKTIPGLWESLIAERTFFGDNNNNE